MKHHDWLILIIFLLSACTQAQSVDQISVITHPDGPLYSGDRISFEVLSPAVSGDQDGSVSVSFDGKELGQADFGSYGIGGRKEAALWWIWDTRGYVPGRYTLTFTIMPGNISENDTFTLLPASDVPSPEPEAVWAMSSTVCCTLHFITGTDAARDIASLSQTVDQQSALVSTELDTTLTKPIDIFFLSRVVGNGGFTQNGIYVSYLSGDYIDGDTPILFHHEFVHYYDFTRGGVYLPSIFEEGLAVYLSGGHFKPEPLMPRAAAMLDLGWYIPLSTLANDFYNQQHEIGYLEASALVSYLVETYGWDAFNEFYRTIPQPASGETVTFVIDTALHEHFDLSFSEFESNFRTSLRIQPFTQQQKTDLEDTVNFFTTARRYQQILDPSAYFLTAWLPNGTDMIKNGIVADFLRRPRNWDNRLLESMLVQAQVSLFDGNYKDTETTLRWTNLLMDVLSP